VSMIGDGPAEPQPQPRAAARRGRKTNGHRKPRANGGDPRLAKREADDQALVNAMRSNPEGSIGDWATTIGKSRTSCVSALHRLRGAGLAESDGGRWALVEESGPREPAPRWVAPLSARSHREHATA
jgi:hypothetical protein